MEAKTKHKTTIHQPIRPAVAPAMLVVPKPDCAPHKAIGKTLPEITPIWVEQTADCRENDLPGPHVLSRNCIRWMW